MSIRKSLREIIEKKRIFIHSVLESRQDTSVLRYLVLESKQGIEHICFLVLESRQGTGYLDLFSFGK
jgi:hypothetical protein